MAFDEDFHLGLIKIYASSLLPYGIEQTRDMATYGAATADPSYLFHYVLSMPYRLFAALGLGESTIVVLLRIINIGFVILSLWLYRKALLAANVSKALTNVVLAFFCLIPILPVVAGQINYDSLLLVVTALSFWLLILVTNYARTRPALPALQTWLLLGTVLMAMPIKYAFLPIALGVILWLGLVSLKLIQQSSFSRQFREFMKSTARMPLGAKVGIVALFSCGLFFAADYVVNYVEYGSAIPKCDIVFDEEACKAYGPWNRNNNLKNKLSDSFQPVSLPLYVAEYWIPGMLMRSTFAVAGPTNDYQTKAPLPVPLVVYALFGLVSVVSLVAFTKRSLGANPLIAMVLVISFIYLASLIWKLYGAYVNTGDPVAINGRYLLPLLPFIGAISAMAILTVLQKSKVLQWLLPTTAVFLALLLLQGGGVQTYIVRGESTWFWPGWGQNSHKVLKEVIQPITID